MTEKDKSAPPPVYGPPQVIYRIDNNRYFTLENYTRCENGQTFYNNKEKGVHVKVLKGQGICLKVVYSGCLLVMIIWHFQQQSIQIMLPVWGQIKVV